MLISFYVGKVEEGLLVGIEEPEDLLHAEEVELSTLVELKVIGEREDSRNNHLQEKDTNKEDKVAVEGLLNCSKLVLGDFRVERDLCLDPCIHATGQYLGENSSNFVI